MNGGSALSPLTLPRIECIESKGNYSRFTVEPLEKGIGITLGNALRRMLLAYLPGAAVTSVKIEGIQHEFTTIPDVKEDTIELLLNIKAIRLRANSGRPGKLLLEVARAGEVYASEIKPSDDFEVVNPELYLATIDSDKAVLNIEMNVELGEGYRQAETSANLPIGVIPVDAVFSPIRKVNFTIAPVHVGRETSRERLILDIWTDGTISPVDAVSHSAELLVQQFSPFVNLSQAAHVSVENKAITAVVSDEKYKIPVEDLDLSVRTMNSLRRGGITTVGDLISKGERELLSLRNFGQKSRQEVEEKLKSMGLTLIINGGSSEDIESEEDTEE